MLGKLIKYEFKATGRLLLPLYGALIIFAFINKIFMGDFFSNGDTFLGGLPQVIAMLVYIGTMVAIFVVTLFIIIQRYRTNLLGDEGYLMNTLPITAGKNILSKLIVAVVWSIVSGIVAVISIIILAYQKGLFSELISQLPRIIAEFNNLGGNEKAMVNTMILLLVEVVFMMLVGIITSILMIYASLSLGNLFSKKKILASFGAFIVLNIVTNTIASVIQGPIMLNAYNNTWQYESFSATPIHTMMLVTMATAVLFSVLYFIICNYVLNKKLNLE